MYRFQLKSAFASPLPLRVFALSLSLIIATACLYQSAAQSEPVCLEPNGQMTRGDFRSQIAATNMYYTVYTPPCYNTSGQTYPVIYLFHGSNENDGAWGRLGLAEMMDAGIAAGTLPPMLMVMPFGEWIANENQFDAVSWENVFLGELLPLVESQYRVDTTRRAIGGISRGGFWSFEIAFRHPEMFQSVGGHSAFFDDYHAPPEYNPLRLAQSAPGIDKLRIWLDRGKDDFAAPGLDLMDERLAERGLDYQYTVYPEGQHYYTYWGQHISQYLHFYGDPWLNAVSDSAPPALVFATNTPTGPLADPTATPQPSVSDESRYLFLPAVSFPSLQAVLPETRLWDVRVGEADASLVLDETTAIKLMSFGLTLAPEIRIVPDDALYNTLWRDGRLYTLLAFDRLSPRYRILNIGDSAPGLPPLYADLAAYPFAFSGGEVNFDPTRLTRLLLSGVTALTRNTLRVLDERGVEWAGEAIQPYTTRADFFHTSNEVSFSPKCPFSDETPLGGFCSKESHFALLENVGLDIVELTGNHNIDYGTQPYLDTLEWYAERGIYTLGGGVNLQGAQTPLIIEHNGSRIAMVACNAVGPYYAMAGDASPGAAACDWTWLRATLPVLAEENDLLIVTVQYLEVEEYQPTAQQVSDFRGMADLGADVVIGTQAHKPQTMEFYGGRSGGESFIHYGLGNIFFDQPFWGNMRFFMDELYIYEGRLVSIGLFTGIIDELARPRPMDSSEQENFLAFMFNTQGSF